MVYLTTPYPFIAYLIVFCASPETGISIIAKQVKTLGVVKNRAELEETTNLNLGCSPKTLVNNGISTTRYHINWFRNPAPVDMYVKPYKSYFIYIYIKDGIDFNYQLPSLNLVRFFFTGFLVFHHLRSWLFWALQFLVLMLWLFPGSVDGWIQQGWCIQPLGGYPSSCSPSITPCCPIQPLYNPYLGGICCYVNVQTPLKPNMAIGTSDMFNRNHMFWNRITPALKIVGFSHLPFNCASHRFFQVLGGCNSNIFVDVQPYTWEKWSHLDEHIFPTGLKPPTSDFHATQIQRHHETASLWYSECV